MKITLASYVSLVITVGTGFAAAPTKDPAALALLRGVEEARGKHDNLRVELVLEYFDRTQRCAIPCLVEQAGQRRRFEQFAGGCIQVGEVTMINEGEVWGYRRKEHADLEIFDMARAVGVRGDIAFDPRILGLGGVTTTSADTTVRELLWVETCDHAELVGREELKGVSTWHLKAKRNNSVSDFWIEEPSFRVHKRTSQSLYVHSEINSEFDPNDPASPFPKRVDTTREEGKKWRRLVVTVKSFEVDKPIPAERFTLKSLDLPVNTNLNDYRISRGVGYWNGEEVVKSPLQPGEFPAGHTRPAHPYRLLFIVLNVVLMAVLIVVLIIRHRWKGKPEAPQEPSRNKIPV